MKDVIVLLYISNFVLELINKIIYLMKKSLIVFIVAALVLGATSLWFFTSYKELNLRDLVHFGVILVVVGFAILVGLKRLGSARRGEPIEDELSRKILQKAAAISYYVSLYMWVFMIFLKDRVTLETEELLGTGILVMAVIFGISWLIISIIGIKHD